MDRRDEAAEFGPSHEAFDEQHMTLSYLVTDDDGEELSIALPAKFEVCSLCEGRGKHVNPSIDAHGISREEFDEDPDFEQDYRSGAYDVDCYVCHGKRVEPVIDEDNLTAKQKEDLKLVRKALEDEANYRDLVAAERRMGC